MAAKYNIAFTEAEKAKFSNTASFGVPIANLKQLLNARESQVKNIKQPGVPADSANNELGDWIMQTRMANPKVRIAIKGDNDADVPTIKN
jgi:hypothetical protein